MNLLSVLRKITFTLSLLMMFSCESQGQQSSSYSAIDYDQFGAYWYQGEAELSSYKLEQARYGEMHQGDAVLIFVTEDFSQRKQVKLDRPQQHPEDKVSVLKLNFTKKFTTGVYPYSMMTSVFKAVPIEKHPRALKMTTSVQEWCGQTFLQLNRRDQKFNVSGFSYFESEGDVDTSVEGAILEDELWNMIRLSPDQLPSGKQQLIPGGMYLRLRHQPVEVQQVQLSLEEANTSEFEGKQLMEYTIEYPELQRTLRIYFEKEFPHLIAGWKEEYRSGFGKGAKTMTTKATLNKRMMLPYWKHNNKMDSKYRKSLGLD